MNIRYTVRVDPDVKVPLDTFAFELAVYLADPDGWAGKGYTFTEVKQNPKVTIRLSTPETIHKICKDGTLSCAELGGHRMYLNASRWMHGAPKSKLDLENYRQYVVSHEMGHILGHDHAKCPGRDQPAPIMMQQTLGIGQCKPNTQVL